jgi:predicted enzyme related to lactoylglutathione lyase
MTAIDILFTGVPVGDFATAVVWYSQLFGRKADVDVTDREVMWRLQDAAWLYVIEDAERAGRALVTLCVSNLDQALADIEARGITSAAIELVGDAGRKAELTDPDGNSINFIEVN